MKRRYDSKKDSGEKEEEGGKSWKKDKRTTRGTNAKEKANTTRSATRERERERESAKRRRRKTLKRKKKREEEQVRKHGG